MLKATKSIATRLLISLIILAGLSWLIITATDNTATIKRYVSTGTDYFAFYLFRRNKLQISNNPYQFQFGLPIENPTVRAKLPLYKTINGLSLLDLSNQKVHFEPDINQFVSWTRSHGDLFSSKFSLLNQISKENIKHLVEAWRFDSDNLGDWKTNVETNPIFSNGLLFFTTPQNHLVAVDVETGTLQWSFKCETIPARRGLIWWDGGDGSPQIFFPTTGGKLIALYANTGVPVSSFGDSGGGVVTGAATSAPAIHNNQLFLAINAPPRVESFDIVTGSKLWSTSLNVRPQKEAGASPWSGISLDAQRGLLFIATGNPKPPFYGGNRPGSNLYSNSIVAIDVGSGTIVWHWQEVEHGLWDFDIPSPPLLTTITRYGIDIDVVVALTKIGNVIVLERDSGKPIFDYRLRRTATSEVPGEVTAAYQPDLQSPEPVSRTTFSLDDVTDIGKANRTSVMEQLTNSTFGFFEPPTLGKTLISFGLHGGAEWPGGAINQNDGILFLTVHHIPWKLRLSLVPSKEVITPESEGKSLYRDNCQVCHKSNRQGVFHSAGEKELRYVPSLVGASKIKTYIESMQLSKWQNAHQTQMTPLLNSQLVLDKILEYFTIVDDELIQIDGILITEIWSDLLDYEDYPGSKPPWGEIVALNLNNGKLLWRQPFGEYQELTDRGIPVTGQRNFGGLLATGNGVIFATGTPDQKIRAFNAKDGSQLWAYHLPAAGSAPPLTYQHAGTQYLTVVATGGLFHNFKKQSSSVISFKLKTPAELEANETTYE